MTQRTVEVEVWQNVSLGSKWYKCFDVRGQVTTKVVRGGKTFTLSPLERQMNQESAANPKQSLFLNGTFVLRRPAEATDMAELASPEALTDEQLNDIVRDVMFAELDITELIGELQSEVTLQRLHEKLIVEDAKKSVIDLVKARLDHLHGGDINERVQVTKPDDDEFARFKAVRPG